MKVFEWDEAKSARNLLLRGLPFDIAIELFSSQTLEKIDDRRDYKETRIFAVGLVEGRCLTCIFTDRGEIRRIISLRVASRKERNAYRAAYPS